MKILPSRADFHQCSHLQKKSLDPSSQSQKVELDERVMQSMIANLFTSLSDGKESGLVFSHLRAS